MEYQSKMVREANPPHTHNVHLMEEFAAGDHKHDHNLYGKHAAGFQKEHERVKAMCGGGMARGKKK
jgi:hypothetical protein